MSEPSALFVGLCTLDIIQAVPRMPGRNEKMTALGQCVAAGGPATNAGAAFACLGGRATLLTGVGGHPLTDGMRADLEQVGVALIDVATGDDRPPAVSSIIVTQESGDRCVVSMNAVGQSLEAPPGLGVLVDGRQAVLIDGHHPALALAAARAARARGKPCILDGGSWKDNTSDLLPHVDVAVCSADFRPPGVTAVADVLDYLLGNGIEWAAVTNGAQPIAWAAGGTRGQIPVPVVRVTDTLGAGDIFHGAFAHAIAKGGGVTTDSFDSALRFGAKVAAYSCQYPGTRRWMEKWDADQAGPNSPASRSVPSAGARTSNWSTWPSM
jgi:sugar/nucleoside kinase (ribokinase family)